MTGAAIVRPALPAARLDAELDEAKRVAGRSRKDPPPNGRLEPRGLSIEERTGGRLVQWVQADVTQSRESRRTVVTVRRRHDDKERVAGCASGNE